MLSRAEWKNIDGHDPTTAAYQTIFPGQKEDFGADFSMVDTINPEQTISSLLLLNLDSRLDDLAGRIFWTLQLSV